MFAKTHNGAPHLELSTVFQWKPRRRTLNALGFVFCAAVLGYAYGLEHWLNLPPCPLCSLQRGASALLGGLFLVAALHDPGRAGARVYAVASGLVGLAGAGIAARHLWLQYASYEGTPVCLPGLDVLLRSFDLSEVLSLVLLESGDCSGISWTLMGISIPGWALLSFLLLSGAALVANWTRR